MLQAIELQQAAELAAFSIGHFFSHRYEHLITAKGSSIQFFEHTDSNTLLLVYSLRLRCEIDSLIVLALDGFVILFFESPSLCSHSPVQQQTLFLSSFVMDVGLYLIGLIIILKQFLTDRSPVHTTFLKILSQYQSNSFPDPDQFELLSFKSRKKTHQ